MTNTQKLRYKIGYVDPKNLKRDIEEFVDSGDYPKSSYQFRKTYAITRELCSLPAKFIKYFRRN